MNMAVETGKWPLFETEPLIAAEDGRCGVQYVKENAKFMVNFAGLWSLVWVPQRV